MKKILVIFPRWGNVSGADTYVESLLQELRDRGYEVHFLTDEKYKDAAPPLPGVPFHYAPGIRSTAIDVRKAYPIVREIVKKISPDIVHIHDFMQLLLYSSVFEQGEHNVVITIHSTPGGHGAEYKLFNWISGLENQKRFLTMLLRRVSPSAIICGSEYYRREYSREVPETTRYPFHVNHYYTSIPGIAPSERNAMDEQKKANGRFRILFPSRPVKRKGIEEALRALAVLPEYYSMSIPAFSQYEGDEQYRDRLNGLIEELGVGNRLEYPAGLVRVEDMPAYYKEADCVIIPSHFEGFGIVGVEALDFCCPVISSFAGGLGEIFVDGESGLRMDIADSPETVAKLIVKATTDTALRHKLIENGKKTVQDKFTVKRHMDKIVRIYQDIPSA